MVIATLDKATHLGLLNNTSSWLHPSYACVNSGVTCVCTLIHTLKKGNCKFTEKELTEKLFPVSWLYLHLQYCCCIFIYSIITVFFPQSVSISLLLSVSYYIYYSNVLFRLPKISVSVNPLLQNILHVWWIGWICLHGINSIVRVQWKDLCIHAAHKSLQECKHPHTPEQQCLHSESVCLKCVGGVGQLEGWS